MKVIIAKVHENLFNDEADSLTVTTTDGVVTILPKHEPLVGIIAPGIASVRTKEGMREFPVTDGVLEVSQDQATLLL